MRRRQLPNAFGVCKRPLLYLLLSLLCLVTVASYGQAQQVRVGALRFGTVNWELDVMQHHGLDATNGIELKVLPLASKRATQVALQGGAVDVVVSDWIWVSRQRAAGRDYTFVPYSMAVGALMVRPDAGVQRLHELEGKRVGVAGGPLDKSWLLLRAYSRQHLDSDVAELVEPNFAAPPLLSQMMLNGRIPAVLTFWHYAAKLEAAGMQPLLTVAELLPALGVDTAVPLLGWVFSEDWASDHRAAITGLLDASYAAKRLLEQSDAEWSRLRPLTQADDKATLHALRDAYRAGIPSEFGHKQQRAAEQLYGILAAEGGEQLVGSADALSPGTFWEGYEISPWH